MGDFKTQLNKIYFHLKFSEWLIFLGIVILYSSLTVWIVLTDPFGNTIDGGNVNFWSISMSWTAAMMTILGTFFLARGKRVGFILDALAFIALAINLMFLATPTMLPLGIFYMLVPIPVTFYAFFLWKKRTDKKVKEKEASKKFILSTIVAIIGGTFVVMFVIIGVNGVDKIINDPHGLGNYWEITRLTLEILKIFIMAVVSLFFLLGIKEAWTFVMALEAVNIALYSISFSCGPQQDAGYFLNIWLYTIEFLVASYGTALWYIKKIRNN